VYAVDKDMDIEASSRHLLLSSQAKILSRTGYWTLITDI